MMSPRRPIWWILLTLAVLSSAAVVARAAPQQQRIYPSPGATDVWPGTVISVWFEEPMDTASVETALSVAPELDADLVWSNEDRALEVRPAEPLAARTVYDVTIDTRALTARGTPALREPLAWSFTTAADTAQVGFGYYGIPIQFVTPAGARGVPIQPGYPRVTLDAALYALDMPAFAARYAVARPGQGEISLEGLVEMARWQAHVDASDRAGRLELPEGTAPGVYVLDVRSPRVKAAQTFLVYSDYALVAKEGRQDVMAWVARVPDGTVAPAAAVTLLDASGLTVASATADADGLVRWDDARARFAVAEVEGQTTLVGLDSNWYATGYYYRWWGGSWMPTAPTLAGHLHTDRPIYRPGHTVHYKASLRLFGDDGFEVPDATMPMTLTVKDAAGNTVATTKPAADAYGSIAGDLPLGEDVSLGEWQLELASEGQTFRRGFRVEEYVKPDYEVKVETDEPYYVTGDTASVTVQADYYFGQPVTDAEVTLRVFRGYYYWYERTGNLVDEFRGRTGPDGSFEVSVPVETQSDRSWPEPYYFEAEVLDASRRPVVSEASVPVHAADFALSVRNERYGVEVGEPVVLIASATGHDGVPETGRTVRFEVRKYHWTEARGSYYEVIATDTVVTDETGQARATFQGLAEGWYNVEVTATDDAGRLLRQSSYAWIYGGDRPWYWRDGLQLTADKDAYAPGDTAHLLLRSPITTTALVTLERDEVYEEIVVDVAGAATIDIPIRAEFAPNVTARVQLWEPVQDPYRQIEGQLVSAETTLSVPATDRRLDVRIAPDAPQHEPGDAATFTVRVTDAEGQPVRAQLSFALVDKAVLALAADTSGDIFDAFWGQRGNTVRTFDSVEPANWYNWPLEDGQRGGQPPSPGNPAPTATASAPNKAEQSQATPRREFPDTAYWNATLETGDDGVATVTLTLPDNLTTWKALARAIAMDTRVGQGDAELVVSKPVIADLALPRFAVQGDEFALDVLGRNYVAGTVDAQCSVETPGLVLLDEGDRDLSLPFGETRTARWSAVAAKLGTNPVTAWLDTPADDDAIELPLEVQPFAVPDRFARAGSTETEALESFLVPYNAIPDGSSVEVRLAPGMAFGVLDGLEELIGYPYGCVEQVMSRMLPNAVIGRLVRVLGLEAPEIEAQLPEMMAIGLQKLYGFQNENGGWGWWHWRYSEGNVYTTAYVLHGLTLTEAAGYDVDPDVLDRGFVWLTSALTTEEDPRVSAYGAYVLGLAGRGDPSIATRLYDRVSEMDAFSMAALALALEDVGRSDLSALVLDKLEAAAVESVTTAHWPTDWENDRYRHYYWYTMANTEKGTAMALDALALLRPDSPLAPKAARWLMENRWGRGWRTTQGTAFAVLGLTDYLVTSGELDAAYDWSVLLDGEAVATGRVDGSNVTERIPPVVIEGEDLAAGEHVLAMRKEGEGTLFYTVVGRLALYSDGFAPAEAEGLGIRLQRTYQAVVGRSGPDGWAVGDVVNVRLELTTAEELHYVIVEDMLPAGFEGLNEALDTETSRVPGERHPWRWWGYERKEMRDERVTFFDSYLPPGTHVFEYAARAVTPGTFSARPAEAYTMYRPEVWGRSASERVLVAADRLAERPDLDGDYDRDCRLTDFDTSLVAEAWGSGRRDVNGDGTTDAADLGTANGRVGLACGDGVPLPPGPAGDLELSLQVPDDVRQGDAFEVEVRLRGSGNVGAMDVTLGLPAGAFDVESVGAGDLLPDGRVLGPEQIGDFVRLGAFAKQGAALDGEAVVARLRLRARQAGAAQIDVAAAQVVTDHGGPYRVSADGVVISPDPWMPTGVAYLPSLAR